MLKLMPPLPIPKLKLSALAGAPNIVAATIAATATVVCSILIACPLSA
jgi:hypothetical protein